MPFLSFLLFGKEPYDVRPPICVQANPSCARKGSSGVVDKWVDQGDSAGRSKSLKRHRQVRPHSITFMPVLWRIPAVRSRSARRLVNRPGCGGSMAATGTSFTACMSGRCWVVRRPTNESQASDAHARHVLLQARQTQGQRRRHRAQHPLPDP